MAAKASARALSVLACWLAASALGCDDAGENQDASDGADAGTWPMELGKGELAFAPLADGDVLPYVHGPQGGQHVWVAFRMRDLDPARVLVQATTAVAGDDELVLRRSGRVNFELAEDAAATREVDAGPGAAAPPYEYAGWPAQILDAREHEGERVQIDIVLEDRAGRHARAHRMIVIGSVE